MSHSPAFIVAIFLQCQPLIQLQRVWLLNAYVELPIVIKLPTTKQHSFPTDHLIPDVRGVMFLLPAEDYRQCSFGPNLLYADMIKADLFDKTHSGLAIIYPLLLLSSSK